MFNMICLQDSFSELSGVISAENLLKVWKIGLTRLLAFIFTEVKIMFLEFEMHLLVS